MREEDVEAIRRGYEAWNRGESILDLVDPDITWSPGDDSPEAGEFTGRDGFVAFVQSWNDTFEEFRLDPEEMTVVKDSVIVTVHQRGRGRGSSVELDIRTVHVWTIRDGLAVGWAAYRSRKQALAAAGEST